MIQKLEELDPNATIVGRVIVTKVDNEYVQYLELSIPQQSNEVEVKALMRELSQSFTDCRFRLDRIIDGLQ